MADKKRRTLRYNEQVRKYEEYFSVSYYEAYIEMLRYTKELKDAYNEMIKVLPLETIKQDKAVRDLGIAINTFSEVTKRIKYYSDNSRQIFLDLFSYVDKDKLVNDYDLDYAIKPPKNYGIRILKALSKEYSDLMVSNKNFRDLVCVILFSIKGSKYYMPILQSYILEKHIKEKATVKRLDSYYEQLKEIKNTINNKNKLNKNGDDKNE